jgi:hypothetical protein
MREAEPFPAANRIEESLKKDSDLAELVSAMGEEIRKG